MKEALNSSVFSTSLANATYVAGNELIIQMSLMFSEIDLHETLEVHNTF